MTVDLEAAIRQFINAARDLQAEPEVTAEAVLQRVIQGYRDVRIDRASLNSDGDMLLLQWGAISPLIAEGPADLRNASADDIAFEQSERQYIDFTRQVFAAAEDEDADFDDSAVQLSMTLVYGQATGDEVSSNQWIENPRRIDNAITKFRDDPFVQRLMAAPASRLVATVQHCG
ncbi:hypothetical protein [Candidatus Laterigemmans baculatus]|uniref:hypothetical protein n=1 Tax=Candidatus Laterigemmans baculatus TaxID=2770505 RepID=UPI0013DCD450|nr:hypothetical protein [Candidatus Laterigemmans baculatus]